MPKTADRAGIGPHQPRDHAQGRGLAGAVRTEQRVELARPDGQIEAVDGRPVEGLGEAAQLERGHGGERGRHAPPLHAAPYGRVKAIGQSGPPVRRASRDRRGPAASTLRQPCGPSPSAPPGRRRNPASAGSAGRRRSSRLVNHRQELWIRGKTGVRLTKLDVGAARSGRRAGFASGVRDEAPLPGRAASRSRSRAATTNMRPSGRSLSPIPPQTVALMSEKGMTAVRPDPRPALQEGIGARGLEEGRRRRIRPAEDVSDLPLVRPARPEEAGRRPAGARGLLHGHARADEPELVLLPVLRHGLSERLRPRPWRHGLAADGAWHAAPRAAATR